MDKDNLSISITKALNPTETPLKMKHARNVIITTHRTKEMKTFWSIITRQPLMEHRFSAWKFCHLVHKVLREGHAITLKHSLSHKTLIIEVGKLWGYLKDGVGICIEAYTKLLVNKLEFHEKNLIFPGSLTIEFHEVERFAGNDLNIYFQLCVEIFDYLDHIIEVQSKIFNSVNTFRMSSMTPQGQCRLAPLITLVQDSNPLYDICVRLMFKLHDGLPNDVLMGHRERFKDLFIKIKHFYDSVRPLQYFADVIQLPSLPENTPNFLSQHDFGNYVAPVVYVQQDQDEYANKSVNSNGSLQPQTTLLDEKENIIKQLQDELIAKENQLQNETILMQKLSELTSINGQLNIEMQSIKERLQEQLTTNQALEEEMKALPLIQNEVQMYEEEAKSMKEKFEKLKIMYGKLRDEHVDLLRLQKDKNHTIRSEVEAKDELKNDLKKLTLKVNELELNAFTIKEEYEQNLKLKDEQIRKLEEQLELTTKLSNSCKNAELELKDELKKQEQLHNEIMQQLNNDCNAKQVECVRLLEEKNQNERKINDMNSTIETLLHDKEETIKQLHIVQDNALCYKGELEQKQKDMQILKCTVESIKDQMQEVFSILMGNFHNILKKMNNFDLSDADKAHEYIEMMETLILQLNNNCEEYYYCNNDNNNDVTVKFNKCKERLMARCFCLTAVSIALHGQIAFITNNSTDLMKAQDLLHNFTAFQNALTSLYPLLSNQTENIQDNDFQTICKNLLPGKLQEIQKLIQHLTQTAAMDEPNLGDMLKNELKAMDEIIEEATNKIIAILSAPKPGMNEIKLEVHEKILDSCTALMKAIKVLIQKSRLLQEEIVAQGKGNFPAKEFYKRNNHWTEGLISASKNIAKGANYLVEAANNSFTSEFSNNLEIIVAAQEIAACTAQLVIASKVKAHKESQKLIDLTKASRDVSQATGAVVAAVKDGNVKLENSNDIDDLSQLTPSQRKTKEMEIHVKVLELEQALQNERYKLSAFRKACYKNGTEDVQK